MLKLPLFLHVLCGVLLIVLAVRMWKHTERSGRRKGGAELVVATILNPKALVLAALLPSGLQARNAAAVFRDAGVALCIALLGACWVALGAFTRRRIFKTVSLLSIHRACAVILALFGAVMIEVFLEKPKWRAAGERRPD